MNGLLRDYFPKRADLRPVTARRLAEVAVEINHRPRKVSAGPDPPTSSPPSNASTVARWDAKPGVTSASSWSLDYSTGIWTVTKPLPELKADAAYTLGSSAEDDGGTTQYVSFTLADPRTLQPGQVRVPDIEREIASAPADVPTGDPIQLAQDDNSTYSKVVDEAESVGPHVALEVIPRDDAWVRHVVRLTDARSYRCPRSGC